MRITDGKVPPSELGFMIKKYNFIDIVSAYAAFDELESKDESWRLKWIRSFLNNKEKEKKELNNLKEKYT